MWSQIKNWFSSSQMSEEEYEDAKRELLKEAPIPVLWLLGKTGSGKSTIVRNLTSVDEIEIGPGYRPQTKFSSRYDFPDETTPLVTFFDTRGIGEADYDSRKDIAELDADAHLLIVTVRAMDHAVDELVRVLAALRSENPKRPVLLAITALHDAYPRQQHPETDPFDEADRPVLDNVSPPDLKRSLIHHYERFGKLVDVIVPIDITPVEEHYDQPDFGADRLKAAVVRLLPSAYQHQIRQISEVVDSLHGLEEQRSTSRILASSSLAATAGAVPLPWIDIPVVMGIQLELIYRLAKLYDQPVDRQTIAHVTGSLGGQVAIRSAVRGALKFIPWVGMAVNAASAFVATYATGKTWTWYFLKVRSGSIPKPEEMQEIYKQQLDAATELWQATHSKDDHSA